MFLPARSRQAAAAAWTRLSSLETNGGRQWQSTLSARRIAKRPTPGGVYGGLLRRLQRQQQPRRGFNFSPWRRTVGDKGAAPEKLSLGARLKKLSKEYGWSAVGVYLALSVLDFPFCFLLVKIVGTEKIGRLEHYVVSALTSIIPESMLQRWRDYRGQKTQTAADDEGEVAVVDWGVAEAQRSIEEEASLATQLALAYAIHKSFIFIRVPLTAAVTPKVVKVLRGWGWNIGKRRMRDKRTRTRR
ncbi:hypothetical protein L249_8806 [Ophiocordyceps polyrhachis-furcata BCC 54312]|uniref:DUF1279 domain-containing protein n=1 Tax=Ophiocordyceps polyrhachis-furcata BCC 54312 TaxID=1330021 RepID=A0A367L1Q3_9HYPO|nr:hypothetical protein L249_8806 [Ophiocordyceps polyrhachis-furcata BCC 54312]